MPKLQPPRSRGVRPLASLICLALLAGPLPALAEETLRCDSRDFRYRYCRADTDDQVELLRQHSLVSCRQNRSWGYDGRGVWVDHGCSADFRVGRKDRHDKALGVGAAIAGIAIIAALAAHKNKQQQEETDVSAWSVGSFTAYDELEASAVELTILPGGSVSGRAGRHEFSGSLNGSRLEAGRYVFRIERSGNGFVAIDEANSRHRLIFQRSGGGY